MQASQASQLRTVARSASDKVFAGSIPKLYDDGMVPLIFAGYAEDLAQKIASLSPTAVLETAAGTGVVTRALAPRLSADARYVVTDLNQPMLDHAAAIGTKRPVDWRQADAMQLPFGDRMFDAVACQFGVMFFPDKAAAFAEARRVLRPGGVFLFNVWDRIEENEFADAVTGALARLFPEDPPRFLARTPHGYCDSATIRNNLANGGFTASPQISAVAARSRARSARDPAVAYCQGTPLRNEIEARDASLLELATDRATQAIASRHGEGPVAGKIQAHVIVAAG